MADISKIKLGSTTYNIKDANAARSSHTHNYAGSSTAGGVAKSAHMIDGFSSHSTSIDWGNQTGTPIKVFNDSTGGSMGWRRDNPVTGQVSQVIDGTVYIKEGAVNVGDAIKSITRNGTTFTYTTLWGNTGTFTQQDNNITYSAGTGISLSGTTFSNSGVRSIATGGTNGTISVNTNGTSADVAVKGLGSAAYTASTAYAAASHTHDDRYYTESEINTKIVNMNKEAFLTWGGQNFAGSYGPIDAAMVPELGANRLAFIKGSSVTIEYSRDGGSTWTDYGAGANANATLFGNGGSFLIGKADSTNKATANTNKYQLRVTIDTGAAPVYSWLNKFVIYISTNGSTSCTVRIQKALQSSPTTFVDETSDIPVSGWSGYNVINTPGFTTYGNTASSQYGRIRFIFKANGGNTSYNGLTVLRIMGFGGVGWTIPSNMAKNGHLYSYDNSQNATFPASVNVVGSLTQNGTAVSLSGHTHNYAGSSSAGGQANDSAKLGGATADTAATNNTIAKRTSSGYLFATYLNQSSGAETPTTSSYIMYANSDGYLRKSSLANIKTILGLGSAAYTASTAYAAASHSHATSIATSSGTNQITLAANTKYAITAGGTSYIFTTPSDTNTWRGIQDNLTSDSTTDSLSAAQGKALKTLVDGKAASGHTHHYLSTIGDQRTIATTPNTYSNALSFLGLKSKTTIGSPSNDSYSYLVGLRGWSDSSGGDSHELAFNNTGIFWRHGATTSWGNWGKIFTSLTTTVNKTTGSAAAAPTLATTGTTNYQSTTDYKITFGTNISALTNVTLS